MSIINNINQAFNNTKEEYKTFFQVFYPGKKSAGFNEANQVSKFLNNYKQLKPDALTWMELSLGGQNGRLDGFILDGETAIFIEAKRLNSDYKLKSIVADFNRALDEKNRNALLGDLCSSVKKQYILLLADIWDEKKLFHKWIKDWENNNPLHEVDNRSIEKSIEKGIVKCLKLRIVSFEDNCHLYCYPDSIKKYHLAYSLYEITF